VKALTERNGFAGYPVVTEDNELVGIITGRDVRFVTDLNQPVSVYMTPKERLVTVREGETVTWCSRKCTKNALRKRWLWMQLPPARHDHR
jgi:IMP dehydrogenase